MAHGGHIEFNTGQTTENNCKTAFSLQRSQERSDGYNFYLNLILVG